MANMYPPNLEAHSRFKQRSSAFISDAEINLFNELKAKLDESWSVYHSVWIRDASTAEHSEGDFVIVGPRAVLVLEVKGGLVERSSDGEWHFSTKKGRHVKSTHRGPVAQARGAWYALKNHMQENGEDRLTKDIVWGYGVVTPDCMLKVAGSDPEFSKRLWLDARHYPESIKEFLDDLTSYWREDQISRGYGGEPDQNIRAAYRLKLDQMIRPEVTYVRGFGIDAREADRGFLRLTTNQYKALKANDSEPRIVLKGGAGTGKTLLALEKARKEAASGIKVLFVCFNRLLADRLNDRLERDSTEESVTIVNYHQLVVKILREEGKADRVSEDWKNFNKLAPDLVLNTITDSNETEKWQWDYLIIDEGQDLLSEQFFSVLDILLRDGIDKGRWLLCIDTEQAIFSQQYDEEFANALINRTLANRIPLLENCRNTHQISAYGHALGDINPESETVIDGPEPIIEYYGDHASFRKKLRSTLNRLVTDFRDAGLDESRITVLLARREEYEAILHEVCLDVIAECSWLAPNQSVENGKIQVSTIQAFKGLESDAVILIGFKELKSDINKKLFYVGATRAKSILIALFPEQVAETVQESAIKILSLQSV